VCAATSDQRPGACGNGHMHGAMRVRAMGSVVDAVVVGEMVRLGVMIVALCDGDLDSRSVNAISLRTHPIL
jgi:hypothetical protein